jgi:molecular chaperone GrpE (heat shock protein)
MLTDRNRVLQTEIGRLHARIEALNDEKNRAQQEAAAVRREAQEAYDRSRQVELGQMLEEKWAQYREERIAELNEEIARHKEEAFAQSTHAAEERYRTLVKENLSDYLQVEREERNRAHEQLSRSRESIAAGISAARIAACDESSRMQREMKEYMDHYMVNFAANMDKWRRSLYNIQLEGFAEWYADFCGFVDNFDARLYSNPDNPNFDAIVKIGKGLKVRRNALENALPSMGLQSFYPAVGGSFDYAYHECAEGDAQDGDRITAVTKPGIYLVASDSDLTQVLVKAEVKTEVN